jgi:ribonuclease R
MSKTDESRVNGTINVHARGFGFLNFHTDEGPDSAFVIPPDLNPFLDGDLVSAEIEEGDDGRFTARRLKLEERRRAILFGEVVQRRGDLWLKTDDEVANTDWPLRGDAKAGQFVLTQVKGNQAEVGFVLDEEEDDIPLERLIARYDLVEEFDDECLDQVKKIAKKPHKLGSRRDLRKVQTITIDAPSTTDLDDAISVLPADTEGAIRLLVSIADPAEFIAEGSALDQEARARGTSTYLSDRVLPMLPHALSSGHLSLVPGKDRCCLTVEMRIDIEGEIRSVDLYESLIHSDTRISYSELDTWLQRDELSKNLKQIQDMLPWLRTAAARLAVARDRRGGVSMGGEESAFVTLDKDGNVTGTRPERSTLANMFIERYMVAANEAVARWLSERGYPAVYRVHAEPDEEKVQSLSESAAHFGFMLGFKGRLTPLALAAFDRQIRGVHWEPAIRSVLRGILEKARYSPISGLHLGLGSPLYLHFTSPLRRYADFVVHRFLKAYLKGERLEDPDSPKLRELCDHLNHRSAMAGKAEAFRRRMLLAEYMLDQVGEEFEAHVTRVLPIGLVAQLDDSLVEGLIPLESLPGKDWETSSMFCHNPNRTIALGEAVRVRLVDAVPEEGKLEYKLLS